MTPTYKKRTLDILGAVERLSGQGHTIAEIAAFLGVSRRTLDRWRVKSPALDDAIKKGQAIAHVAVSRALWDGAIGRVVKSEVVTPIVASDGTPVLNPKDGKPLTRIERTYHPANLGCQVFWLCNRHPDLWKNTQRVEIKREDEQIRELIFTVREPREDAEDHSESRRPVPVEQLDPLPALPDPGGNGHGGNGSGETAGEQ